MTDLALAIDHLGAVRVGRGEYAYRDDYMRRLYVSDSADLRDLGRKLRRGERDAYSVWCSQTLSERATKAQRAKYEGVV